MSTDQNENENGGGDGGMIEDRRFQAASREFEAHKIAFTIEVLLHVSMLVREERHGFPAATEILTEGEHGDDGELKVRVQQVHAGGEVLFDVMIDGEFGNLDEIDDTLTFLAALTGEDYLGVQEIDLYDETHHPREETFIQVRWSERDVRDAWADLYDIDDDTPIPAAVIKDMRSAAGRIQDRISDLGSEVIADQLATRHLEP